MFHIWVTSMPSTFFDDCCLRKRNIFSIVTTSRTVTVSHRLQQCTPCIDGGHRLHTVLYDIIKKTYGHICPVVRCSIHQWMAIGCLSCWRWASQMRVVHLHWLDTINLLIILNVLSDPEKQFVILIPGS